MTMEDMLDLKPYDIGDKIGQIVWLNFPNVALEVVDKLSETERGKGGHGSTGK
jgi:dUTPase